MNKSIINEICENEPLQRDILIKSRVVQRHERLYCIQKGSRFEVQIIQASKRQEIEKRWKESHINFQYLTSYMIKDVDELKLIADIIIIVNS